jgi:hypothetical protein
MTVRATRAGATRWQLRGITALTAARTGVAWQQRWQQGPGRGQRSLNNSSKSKGNAATTVARTIARDTQQDTGNAVTMTGYCGNGSDEVRSNSGGESKGQRTMTAGNNRRWRWRQQGSKGNIGENGERGGNSGGGASHLCLIFFWFWLGS